MTRHSGIGWRSSLGSLRCASEHWIFRVESSTPHNCLLATLGRSNSKALSQVIAEFDIRLRRHLQGRPSRSRWTL